MASSSSDLSSSSSMSSSSSLLIPELLSEITSLDAVPDYLTAAIPFVLGSCVVEFVIGVFLKQKLHRLNDSLFNMALGAMELVLSSFTGALQIVPYAAVFNFYRLWTIEWSVASYIGCFVAVDFGYYWFHRAAHQINMIWAAHSVHHSSEEYNLTVALRQGLLQTFFSWTFYLPLAVLGLSPPLFALHKQFNSLFQFWVHTKLIGKLGWLEYILMTPSSHRVHHGRNKRYIDVNYGGVFIVWDRLFRTYEGESEEVVYGLVHPLQTFDPLWHNLHHWSYMWSLAKDQKTVSGKLMVLFRGPGWDPSSSTGADYPLPDVQYPVVPYDPWLPKGLTFYIVVHFGLAATSTLYLIMEWHELPLNYVFALGLYIPLCMASFAAFYDRNSWAFQMETVRLVVSLALRLKFLRWFGGAEHPFTGREAQSWVVYLFTIGSLVWVRFYYYYYGHLFMPTPPKTVDGGSMDCKEDDVHDDPLLREKLVERQKMHADTLLHAPLEPVTGSSLASLTPLAIVDPAAGTTLMVGKDKDI